MICPIWVVLSFLSCATANQEQFAPNGADLPGANVTVSQGRAMMPIDSGWARFRFALMGPPVTYHVPTGYFGNIEVTLTDAFCPGDSFSVFLNDQRLVFNTPQVPAATCAVEVTDPELAMRDPAFSSGRARLAVQAGDRLTIVPRTSPISAGRAFLRISSVLQTTSVADDDFFIVTSPRVPRRMASNICNILHSRIAFPDDLDLKEALGRANLQGRPVWTTAASPNFQGACPAYALDRNSSLMLSSLPCEDGLAVACVTPFKKKKNNV